MTDEWTQAQMDKMDLDETGIDGNQLAWILKKCTEFIRGGGGTFRCFVDDLGSDYTTVYCAGGMEFTNAVFEALHGEIPVDSPEDIPPWPGKE